MSKNRKKLNDGLNNFIETKPKYLMRWSRITLLLALVAIVLIGFIMRAKEYFGLTVALYGIENQSIIYAPINGKYSKITDVIYINQADTLGVIYSASGYKEILTTNQNGYYFSTMEDEHEVSETDIIGSLITSLPTTIYFSGVIGNKDVNNIEIGSEVKIDLNYDSVYLHGKVCRVASVNETCSQIFVEAISGDHFVLSKVIDIQNKKVNELNAFILVGKRSILTNFGKSN